MKNKQRKERKKPKTKAVEDRRPHISTFVYGEGYVNKEEYIKAQKDKEARELLASKFIGFPAKYDKQCIESIINSYAEICWKTDSSIHRHILSNWREVANTYYRQDGKCAITGVQLLGSSGFGTKSVGIDIINYKKQLIKNNIRLVIPHISIIRHLGTRRPVVQLRRKTKTNNSGYSSSSTYGWYTIELNEGHDIIRYLNSFEDHDPILISVLYSILCGILNCYSDLPLRLTISELDRDSSGNFKRDSVLYIEISLKLFLFKYGHGFSNCASVEDYEKGRIDYMSICRLSVVGDTITFGNDRTSTFHFAPNRSLSLLQPSDTVKWVTDTLDDIIRTGMTRHERYHVNY